MHQFLHFLLTHKDLKTINLYPVTRFHTERKRKKVKNPPFKFHPIIQRA